MAFNQKEYINSYNKKNYKMYQFRVKHSESEVIDYLDHMNDRNGYLLSLIRKEIYHDIYTIKQIKTIIKPIMKEFGINDIYLFGSYARGEANINSDIDIYCEKGNVRTLLDHSMLLDELKEALNREVDLVFETSDMDEFFKAQIMEDMIKLC